MSQETVDIARRGYEAMRAGDMGGVLELLDPDVSVEVHTGRPDLPEMLHGHEGFLQNLQGLTEVFEDIDIEAEEFIDLDDTLIVTIRTVGHGRASGIRIENRVVHVLTIRDRKATRFRVYLTREAAFEALGIPDPDGAQK
jgi:ketosteroid isomerase-like protein